jgi:hypothetical protein
MQPIEMQTQRIHVEPASQGRPVMFAAWAGEERPVESTELTYSEEFLEQSGEAASQ